MTKSARERVWAAFSAGELDDAGRKEALDYLTDLRSATRELSATLNRTALFTLIVVAIFELLTASDATQVNIAGFVLEDLSFIYKFLPLVASYFFFELILISIKFREALDVHSEAVNLLQPLFYRNDLELPLLPVSRAFFPISQSPAEENQTSSLRITQLFGVVFAVAVLLLPLAFLVQAIVVFVTRYGWLDPIVWISIAPSVVVVAGGYAVFIRYVFEVE